MGAAEEASMTPWNLFLDDFRSPIDRSVSWTVCRTAEEAQELVLSQGCPQLISFDHDLGEAMTGYDFAKWLIEQNETGGITIPSDFKFKVHSANPVGAQNIRAILTHYLAGR